jgi:hypothetical protein
MQDARDDFDRAGSLIFNDASSKYLEPHGTRHVRT